MHFYTSTSIIFAFSIKNVHNYLILNAFVKLMISDNKKSNLIIFNNKFKN